MRYQINTVTQGHRITIATTCPHCGHKGTFVNVFGPDTQETNLHIWFGMRRCPNDKCKCAIFFVAGDNGDIVYMYPNPKISFDAQKIPGRIKSAFDEALICHSNNCFVASAIMIRKTLEEICEDKKVTGDNLFKRIEKLRDVVVLPNELLSAMQELRLLGNDAAHLEAQTFEQIGKEELEISIELTKEILKAVYQYESLLEKIQGLKKK
jgi:hypothetical protein